ncbi:diguanylate cyclase/phosphodiesterase (ggdef & eal domains) with pas/pac sensor(s) [hydrocarbon metagenome]|uniref:histidine kinase n=1 Tax=hydrocarbon metagenome TaxID=938273 RepID=A0A0W8EV60_9ZZZZ
MVPARVAAPGIAVLLVDDEPSLLELGRRFLERAGGIRVTTAPSAPAAMTLLSSGTYDAVVSDYQMPEVNGIDFLRQVRAAGDSTPFIIFTGKGREEVAIEALNSGADFYLQKGGDPKAQFAELLHVIRQVVSGRRSERALSEMQQRTAEILEFLPDATFAIDTRGVVIAWNHAMEVMTGVKKDAILGEGNYAYAVPFYGERRPILIDLIFGGAEIVAGKYPYVRKEGDRVFSEIFIPHLNGGKGAHLWFTASPLYDSAGDIAGAIESIRDITDRKLAEEALQRSEAQYRLLAENAADLIYRIDLFPIRHFSYVSPSAAGITGYTPEDHYADPDLGIKMVHPEDRPLLEEMARRGVIPDKPIVLRWVKKDGTVIWTEQRNVPVIDRSGNLVAIEGIARDITDRKLAEGELRKSREQFRAVVEGSGVGFWDWQVQTGATEYNERWAEIVGYTLAELAPLSIGTWTRLCHPEDLARSNDLLQRHFAGQSPMYECEARMRHKEGHWVWVLDRGKVIERDPDGLPIRMTGTHLDITDRKQAELALRESESRYRLLAEKMNDIVFTQDLALQTTFVSPSVKTVLGFTPEERMEQGLVAQVTPGSLAVIHETFVRELAREQAGGADPDRSITLEVEYYHKDGTTRWCEIVTSGIRDDRGVLTGFHGVARDITARKAAEEALRESEERFRGLFEQSPVPYHSLDAAGRFIAVNNTWLETLGYSRDEVIGHWFGEFVVPEHRKLFTERFPVFKESGYTRNTEFLMQRKDGSVVLASFDGRVAYNPDGSFRQTHSIFQDITRTKQVQEALEKSEAEKALILGSITDMVAFYASPDLRITWANRASGDSVSCSSVAMSEHHCYTIWHQRDAPCEPCPVLRAFATGEPQQMEVTSPDGRVWLLRAFPARDDQGAVTGVVEVGREITGLKQAREALRESEEEYRTLFEESPEAVIILAPDMTIERVNAAALSLGDIPAGALIGRPFTRHPYIPEGEMPRLVEMFGRVVAGERIEPLEIAITPGGRESRWLELYASSLLHKGAIRAIQVIARDITGWKQAEEALRESREQYYDLAAHAPVGILTCDREGRITFVNQRMLEMLGSPGEAETRAINLLKFPPLIEAGFAGALQKTLDEGIPAGPVELEYTSHWGMTAWYRGYISPIIDDGLVTGARIILDDISERREVEEALRATNRKLHLLSSITRHDTNNQLLVINGFLDLLQSEVPYPGLQDFFTRITGASEKIATIMRFTKVYEAVGVQSPLWQDVHTLVEHAAAEIPPETVGLVNEIPPEVEVSADPLIEKVFSNLVDNAVRYGETITTIRFSGQEQENTYVVVCEDDGVGIPADEKEKIFLHGFGKNTGLGLFLAREILAITGISIRETGEQGKGARFEIVVPQGRYRVSSSKGTTDGGSLHP